jgi:hypothetical protein
MLARTAGRLQLADYSWRTTAGRLHLADYSAARDSCTLFFCDNLMEQDGCCHILHFLHFIATGLMFTGGTKIVTECRNVRLVWSSKQDILKLYSFHCRLAVDWVSVVFKGRVVLEQCIHKIPKYVGIKIHKLCSSIRYIIHWSVLREGMTAHSLTVDSSICHNDSTDWESSSTWSQTVHGVSCLPLTYLMTWQMKQLADVGLSDQIRKAYHRVQEPWRLNCYGGNRWVRTRCDLAEILQRYKSDIHDAPAEVNCCDDKRKLWNI